MAKYTQSAYSSDALTKMAWEEKFLYREPMKNSFFNQFSSEGVDNIVQIKNDFTKSKGDTINIGLLMKLSGAGVDDGTTVEGKEESLTKYAETVALSEYKHAVRYDKGLTEQRANFSLPAECTSALQIWVTEKIDKLMFDQLADTDKVLYTVSGTLTANTIATAKAAVTSTDVLTPKMLRQIRPWLETGNNRARMPLRPVLINGRKHFLVVISPNAATDFKDNSEYLQYVREAEVRGKNNPWFTGAIAIVDDFVIMSHENISEVTSGSGGAVRISLGTILGAQALLQAWAKRPYYVSKEFGYDEEEGQAVKMIMGAELATFNSLAYGSIGLYTKTVNYAGL